MTVTALRITPVNVPMTCTYGTPYPARSHTAALVVILELQSGLRGESVLIGAHRRQMHVLREMMRSLEPLVVGTDPADWRTFSPRARDDSKHVGYAGVVAIAIGAIEAALLDLAAKASDQPVHRLLGAKRDAVRAYYSSGFWPKVPLDVMVKTAQRVTDAGYRAIKVRVGGLSLDDNVRRLTACERRSGLMLRSCSMPADVSTSNPLSRWDRRSHRSRSHGWKSRLPATTMPPMLQSQPPYRCRWRSAKAFFRGRSSKTFWSSARQNHHAGSAADRRPIGLPRHR